MNLGMYHVEVVRQHSWKNTEYIGRPSPLGNPYPIGPNADRNKVCDDYEEWFKTQIAINNPLVCHELMRLHRIGKINGVVRLGCFCAPARCHGDTIAEFMMNNYDLLEEWIHAVDIRAVEV